MVANRVQQYESAVDTLHTLLSRKNAGLPLDPFHLQIPSLWNEGDFNPPAKPGIGQATIGDDGAVEIIVSPDPDGVVDGYKLFMANDPEHEFSPVIELFGDSLVVAGQRTIIRDTVSLGTLTRDVYYKVKAYDVHFNESEASEIISLERPDIIAPPRPVFKDITVGANEATFEIAVPQVKDLRTVTLFRKDGKDSKWQPIQRFRDTSDIITFTDDKLVSGKSYFYRLQAEDQSGLGSAYSNEARVQARCCSYPKFHC